MDMFSLIDSLELTPLQFTIAAIVIATLGSLLYALVPRYSPLKSWWHGKKDGKIGIDNSHYEDALCRHVEVQAERIEQRWQRVDKRLRKHYCNRKAELRFAATGRDAAAARLDKAQTGSDTERERFKDTFKIQHLGSFGYFVIFGFVCLLEIALNLSVAAEMFPDQGPAMGAIGAVVISAVFGVIPHLLGMHLAHGSTPDGPTHPRIADYAAIGGGVLLLAANTLMGVFRAKHFTASQGFLASHGVATLMSPTTAAVVFTLLSVIGSLAVIILSRMQHHPDLIERRKSLKAAKRLLGQESHFKDDADQSHARATERFRAAESARRSKFADMQSQVNQLNKTMQELLVIYRRNYAVGAATRSPGQKSVFETLPTVGMPEGLRSLDETCVIDDVAV